MPPFLKARTPIPNMSISPTSRQSTDLRHPRGLHPQPVRPKWQGLALPTHDSCKLLKKSLIDDSASPTV